MEQEISSGREPVYPLEPKPEQREKRETGEELSKFLLRLSGEIETADREKRLKLFRQMIKTHKYADGNFYGYVDENCEWKEATKGANEVWYSDNQLYPYLKTALMEMSRGQPLIQINAAVKSEELEAVARFAQERYNQNRDRTFSALLKQTENTYALYNGITFRYTFFQFDGARQEKIPKVIRRDAEKTEKRLCGGCSRPIPNSYKSTNAQLDTPCRHCGSSFISLVNYSNEPDTVIGYDALPFGENKWISPNPVGIIVSMQAASIEETPFLKWKQLILRSVLEDKFKGIELPSTGTESLELRYISNQQVAVPSEAVSAPYETNIKTETGRELELLEFHQVWLDYPLYCTKTFDKDQKLSNGKVLKAGQELGTMFQKGFYFSYVGDQITDTWNESKNRKWTASPYSLRAGSMYGAGSMAVLTDQETLNDLERLFMANLWSVGVPREFVDSSVITELSSDPSEPTTFNGADRTLDSAYQMVAPAGLGTDAYGQRDAKQSAMQNKIGAMSGGAGGLADTKKWGNTATSISIQRDLSVGRFAPDLELMADNLDKKQAYQFLENEQQYFTPKQWKRVKGDYDEQAVKGFLKCDIRSDLVVTVAPGSYMPKSDAQNQAKLMSLLEVLPVVLQTGNTELISYVFETMGAPEHLGGISSDRIHVHKVIGRFKALAEMYVAERGDIADTDLRNPRVALVCGKISQYSQLPVDLFLDNHPALVEAYRDWRSTDEGRGSSNLLTAAVAFRVLQHQKAITEAPLVYQELQQDAVASEVEAEEEKRQLLAENVESLAKEESERGEDMQILSAAADAEEAESDRQHEEKLQANEFQTQKELKAMELRQNSVAKQ